MRKNRSFLVFTAVFYAWYICMGMVYYFFEPMSNGALHTALIVLSPPMWGGVEFASTCILVWLPIIFFISAIIAVFQPQFTKKQKTALMAMPAIAYAMIWIMEISVSV